jgi:hypothetical protein
MRTKPPCTNYKLVRGTICEFHNDCCNSRGTKEEKDKTHQSLECEYKARVGVGW